MLNCELTARVSRETTLALDEAERLVDRAIARGLSPADAYTVIMAAYSEAAACGWHPSVQTVDVIARLLNSGDSSLDYFNSHPDVTEHERIVAARALLAIASNKVNAWLSWAMTSLMQTIRDALIVWAETLARSGEQLTELFNPDHNEEDEVQK